MLHRLLQDLSVDRAWNHLQWLTREAPERLSGSLQANKVDDYLAAQLTEYGLEVAIPEFDALLSFPEAARLEMLCAEPVTIHGRAQAQSLSTPPEGLEAELIHVGQGGVADYEGVDAHGKIVLTELSYTPPRPEKCRIAMSRGAVGLVVMNWGLPEHDTITFGTVKPVWGLPTPETITLLPDIPAMGIRRSDGEQLKRLSAGGRVRVRMHSKAGREWIRSQQVVARVPGLIEPETFILVGGHVDAWDGGVTDNATGNALKLELARAFSKLRSGLKRSVVFCFWMGHETGMMTGSTWFVDHYWDALRDHCLLYLNIDSPGMAHSTTPFVWSSPETIAFHSRVETRVLGQPATRDRLRRIGDQSFFGIGVPAMAVRTVHSPEIQAKWHRATLGWWNHSTFDTLDKADKSIMGGTLRLYAAYIEDLVNRPVLPFNFVHTAEEYQGRLTALQQEAGGALDLSTLSAKASRLRERAAALEAARAEMDERMATSEAAWSSDRVRLLNQTLMKLSRVLTSALATVTGRYSQDTYGLTALSKPIPGLYEAARLAAFPPEDAEGKLLRTKLVRERNRVSDALDEACWIADAALDRLGVPILA